MTKQTDFTKIMQDMMAAFPVDAAPMKDIFRNQVAFGEKLSQLALDAAGRSTDLAASWTRDTLSQIGEATRLRSDAAEYGKAASDMAAAANARATENMASLAEIAKKLQMDTVELMLAAGKSLQDEAGEVMAKATATVTPAARKAR